MLWLWHREMKREPLLLKSSILQLHLKHCCLQKNSLKVIFQVNPRHCFWQRKRSLESIQGSAVGMQGDEAEGAVLRRAAADDPGLHAAGLAVHRHAEADGQGPRDPDGVLGAAPRQALCLCCSKVHQQAGGAAVPRARGQAPPELSTLIQSWNQSIRRKWGKHTYSSLDPIYKAEVGQAHVFIGGLNPQDRSRTSTRLHCWTQSRRQKWVFISESPSKRR